MAIEEDTSPEDTSPRGRPSLLYMVLAAISIFVNFVLIVLYFKRMKLLKAQGEEWIWVDIITKTGSVRTEIQRKDIQEIEKTGATVTELVELAVTTQTGYVFIRYVTKKHKKEEIEKLLSYKHLPVWIIETSEEDESVRKGTVEIEIREKETKTPYIRRIKQEDLVAERTKIEEKGGTLTKRETKEERRNKTKKLKEEGAGKKLT